MENFFLVLILSVVVNYSSANQGTTATPLSKLSDKDLLDLGKKWSQTESLPELKKKLLDLDSKEISNFECCFNSFTTRLIPMVSKQKQSKIETVSDIANKMVGCAVVGSEGAKVNVVQKITWLSGLESEVIKDGITNYGRCNIMQGTDKTCCAKKYHDKIEVQLVQDCVHKAMLCRMEGGKDCLKKWNSCFFRQDCTTPLSLKTTYAQKVKTCSQQNTKLEDIIQCIIQTHHLLVGRYHKYGYCYKLLSGRGNLRMTEYKSCLNIQDVDKTDGLFEILALDKPTATTCPENKKKISPLGN